MNTQDLRVIKTRQAIRTVFLEMLRTCPIEKISVSALAREAQINKATFYLHYQDIYDLYNQVREGYLEDMIASIDYFPLLTEQPEKFLEKFNDTLSRNFGTIRLLWPRDDVQIFHPRMMELCTKKIYGACHIQPSPKADIVLDLLFNCILNLSGRYFQTNPALSQEVLADMIHALLLPLCQEEEKDEF